MQAASASHSSPHPTIQEYHGIICYCNSCFINSTGMYGTGCLGERAMKRHWRWDTMMRLGLGLCKDWHRHVGIGIGSASNISSVSPFTHLPPLPASLPCGLSHLEGTCWSEIRVQEIHPSRKTNMSYFEKAHKKRKKIFCERHTIFFSPTYQPLNLSTCQSHFNNHAGVHHGQRYQPKARG